FLVDGDLWLVMEYMDGGTLQDVLRQTHMAEGEMVAVNQECLQGLDFLHGNPVIHRDLKSSNILLGMDGSVKLGGCSWPGTALRCSCPRCSGGALVRGHSFGSQALVGVKEAGRALSLLFLQARALIRQNGTPQLQEPRCLSALLRDFLECSLEPDEERRWSAQELLQVNAKRLQGKQQRLGGPLSSLITAAKQLREQWR
ncbi:PAK1 kinase, partial [Vidua chalybeata]|nr:PAK1 kinase [Vidua chalybeata]